MSYPKSPKEMAGGMMWFPRMLDKIRLHARGELPADYLENLGNPRAADGGCCAFMRVDYAKLRERVLEGGADEEILEWCYENGRRLNEADLFVWNELVKKLGWRDFATPTVELYKSTHGLEHRDDIQTMTDLIDLDEGRLS